MYDYYLLKNKHILYRVPKRHSYNDVEFIDSFSFNQRGQTWIKSKNHRNITSLYRVGARLLT